uniref:Uncharacterized protein n=1 Tax=Anopheles minimus TaxID=112268 RepID=A0A182WQ76_9DIPT
MWLLPMSQLYRYKPHSGHRKAGSRTNVRPSIRPSERPQRNSTRDVSDPVLQSAFTIFRSVAPLIADRPEVEPFSSERPRNYALLHPALTQRAFRY